MSQQIFINLPVKDLNRSIGFYTQLGYSFNAQFTNEQAACMIVSDTIYVMLLTEPFFTTFTKKAICDTSGHIEAILALSFESREAVDEIADKALAADAVFARETDDKGFMYTRSFEDPDGHLWEMFFMDLTAIPQN